MNLIVDIGNSLVKIAVFQKDKIIHKKKSSFQELNAMLQEVQKEYSIKEVIVSSVKEADYPRKLHFKHRTTILDSTTALPFQNLYETPETLGNDRKALVAAASKKHKNQNTLVIDAGTCITYDFKNNKNQYLGGAISPGLQMRFQALHTFTANLPLLNPTADVELIGNNTKNCLSSGALLGFQKEIEGNILAYKERFKDLTVIFTGGDLQFLPINIKNSIFANSNFLLEGLNYILEFNKRP